MTRQEKDILRALVKQTNVDEVYVKCPVLEYLYIKRESCKNCTLNCTVKCREKEER